MTRNEVAARIPALKDEMRAMNDQADSGFDQARWDVLSAELAGLDAAERRQKQVDAWTLDAPGTPVDGRFDAFAAEVRISDVIAATMGETTRGASMAREASQEITRQRGKHPAGLYVSMRSLSRGAERRDVVTSGAQGTPPNGAPLIPTVTRGDLLIDALRSQTVLARLGVTYLTGLTGNISVPRVSQGTSVGWFAENAPIPDTSIGFDAVSLQIKHVGAIIEYSRNLLLSATPDIDALLRSDLMRALAVEVDRAALVGSGDGIQPRGIIGAPGVQKVPFGGTLSWQNVLTLASTPANANVPATAQGFIGTSRFRAKAMQTLSAPGVASQFIMDNLDSLAGFPFACTNLIPVKPGTTGANATPATSTLIFGSFSNLLVGVWDALDLSTNSLADSVYRKGNTLVRIIADMDTAIRHPEAFVYADDVGV